jgi:hypothetical protein
VDLTYHGVFEQVVITEGQRLSHQTIDDQIMSGRINIWNAGVMPFKVQAIGCNCALQVLQR